MKVYIVMNDWSQNLRIYTTRELAEKYKDIEEGDYIVEMTLHNE